MRRLILAILAALPMLAFGASDHMPKLYTDSTENVHWVIIGKGNPYNFQVLYSVPITAKAGDIIQVNYEGEATNPQSFTIEVGSFVVLGSTPTDTAQSKSILRAKGENVTPTDHHRVVSGSRYYEFTADFTGYVNVVVYSSSTAATGGQQVEFMQAYGQLDVLHFEKATTVAPEDPAPVVGGVTLSAAQAEQVRSALLIGSGERSASAQLIYDLAVQP